jgi:N-methylhydantoinase A
MALDLERAQARMQDLARSMSLPLEAAAWGVIRVANSNMERAIRTISVERGHDPRRFTLVAFGGAGPVHAYGLAKKIGAHRILVPPLAGVGSALGFFTAPVAFDLTRSHRVSLNGADLSEIEQLFQDLEKEGAAILQQAGKEEAIIFERTLMMRFVGQGAETDLAIEQKPFDQWEKSQIRGFFDAAYKKLYGRTYPETPVEFVTFKVRASLPTREFRIPAIHTSKGRLADCIKGERNAFSLTRRQFIPFTVYDRFKLFPGAEMPGPAIIEERESTIVVGEDATAKVDDFGFVWINLNLENKI